MKRESKLTKYLERYFCFKVKNIFPLVWEITFLSHKTQHAYVRHLEKFQYVCYTAWVVMPFLKIKLLIHWHIVTGHDVMQISFCLCYILLMFYWMSLFILYLDPKSNYVSQFKTQFNDCICPLSSCTECSGRSFWLLCRFLASYIIWHTSERTSSWASVIPKYVNM